ncbi:MAG TPA: chorismate mutase [Flavipsychrobacter sp.]|nr:chorismate mutase [Flavipsychrobacter sp.]
MKNNDVAVTEKKKNNKALIIAGPCSAETETQVMNIAKFLAASGKVDLFRAGIWKPRTRPGSFEGVGSIGLKWLRQVKEEYGLPCCTEVATAKHVYEALKYNIDTLWIGARTTTNPFALQEIATALRGSKINVMIKNPLNPDIELWTGAIERIMKANVGQVSLIHRGFSIYEKHVYRNAPYWEISIELHKRFPELPLICDPSHLGGDKKYLYEISSKAIELGYDGLMVETHPNPESALSDAKQQITGEEFLYLLEQLAITTHDERLNPIHKLRRTIDVIDDNLLDMIEQRMEVAKRIGKMKKYNNQKVIQRSRWNQVMLRLTHKGKEKGLSDALIKHVFTAIHEESIRNQTEIVD